MGQKLAIDFGTTNSVIARWDSDSAAAEFVLANRLRDRTAAQSAS